MTEAEKNEILEKAKTWFKETIMKQHIVNTKKLVAVSEFNINPFLASYLAHFLTGDGKPESIAKALVYPRVLGTSINTSFGAGIQKFTTDVLSSFASTTSGIDIEFIDCIDNRKKFCQLKAGPTTINKDDVETIAGHFKSIINLAKTNNVKVSFDDLIVGVIYGEPNQLSANYKKITSQYFYPVLIGADFWYHLTGDEQFYLDLISAVGCAANESNYSNELNEVIAELSQSEEIKKIAAEQ